MKRRSAFSLFNATLSLLVGTTLYGMGCSAEPNELAADQDESRIGTAEQYSGGGGDPGTHNHFRPACFWDHAFQQTARDLAQADIADENGELPSMPYMPSPSDPSECRQEALEVLIGCALGPDKSVVDPEDGRVYEGQLGFAGGWTDGPLTTEEKVWLTSCMVERLNAFGNVMSILVYTRTDSAEFDPIWFQSYSFTESQAWGNLFDSRTALNPTHDPNITDRPAFEAFVCQELGLYTCTVAEELYTSGRICDDGDPLCGLFLVGACENECPSTDEEYCDIWEHRMYARTPDDAFCDVL